MLLQTTGVVTCVRVCKNSQNPQPKRKFHQALTKEKISPTLNQRQNFPNPKLKEKISLTLTITLTLKPNPNPKGRGFITILTLTKRRMGYECK